MKGRMELGHNPTWALPVLRHSAKTLSWVPLQPNAAARLQPMPSSTGATHGRAGGVAGAGSRAARALAAAPRVVPVGTLRTPLGPLNGAVPDAPSKKRKAAAVAGIEASEEL